MGAPAARGTVELNDFVATLAIDQRPGAGLGSRWAVPFGQLLHVGGVGTLEQEHALYALGVPASAILLVGTIVGAVERLGPDGQRDGTDGEQQAATEIFMGHLRKIAYGRACEPRLVRARRDR